MIRTTLGILTFVLTSSVAWGQTAVLEGQVFNRPTGSPLENVEVLISIDGSIETAVARPVLTDSNGFYSIQISERDIGDAVQISARCPILRRGELKTISSGRTHPVVLRESVMIRNLYISVSRRSVAVRCERLFSTQ
jgi:hypothetical protein